MKKGLVTKLGAAALALSLVTASLVGGTFAKYTKSANGIAKATVAKFDLAFKEGTNEFTEGASIVLNDTSSVNAGNVASGKVAPGGSGELTLAIDGNGTEVGYDYAFTIEKAAGNSSEAIKFYKEAAHTNLITDADLKGTVALDDAAAEKTITVYWAWTNTTDAADLALQGTELTYNITMTATQTQTTTP